MRQILLVLFIAFTTVAHGQPPAEQVLERLLESVEDQRYYTYDVKIEAKQYGQKLIDSAAAVIDIEAGESSLGTRFAFRSDSSVFLYDGTDIIMSYAEESVILDAVEADPQLVQSTPYLLYSPYTLKNLLPVLLTDTSTKTIVLNMPYADEMGHISLYCDLPFGFMPDGTILRGDQDGLRTLIVAIDTSTWLPTYIKDIFPNEDYSLATFSSMTTHNTISPDAWKLQSVPDGFIRMDMADFARAQMARQDGLVGKSAPQFTLRSLDGKDYTLIELKGTPVLLEFWFPGCQGCISSIPTIQRFKEEYGPKGLVILAPEFSNTGQDYVRKYVEKYEMHIPVLLNGKDAAVQYGTNAGPTFVLVDRDQTVVYYKVGLEAEELEKAIQKSLHN